jgi:threonine dehydrogenase-like Zn-dependent dehydrogenase
MRAFVAEAEWKPRKDYPLTEEENKRKRAIVGNQAWQNPRFALTTVPTPAVLDDEVLVRVAACGICGSDTHIYETDPEGYIIFSGLTKLPCIPGHEFSGEVTEVGKDVIELKKGDIVTSESIMWCGKCLPCRSGMLNQCENVELMGLSSNGAFADFISVKAKYCWKLNSLEERFERKDVFQLGTLVEPIGCAYNGIFISGGGFLPGSHAIIYGAGPIGLGAVLLLRTAGAAKIIAVDVVEERLAIARRMGADVVLNIGNEPHLEEVLKELTSGRGADIQVEAAGAVHITLPLMQKLCSTRGKIITLGRVDTSAQVDLNRVVSGAHAIIGSRGHSGYGIYPEIIRLLEGGRLNGAKDIVTSMFTFSRIEEGFALSAKRTEAKILIEMG